ncbi:YqaJ viral recombinase family protein [Lacrimispora sphenoides]|uniref:Phage-type endonuclease n=1 Tax=Lacrimispora sphenoides JCM 1415 TaxID=1297793 RepID=A0ABY1C277_9FIRM|nr:YqaJ viral recombinase family protein [Lacrimispora sphenoides]SET55902.1 putative phage-type endonuclease [[Clostridium] sphenoides JCM 1415]SUY49749.1 putative phage-type endonuclease [Lacrimispora sphenoides]
MSIKISTTDLTHEEWRRLRKAGIGGSDAGAICGLNPYSSPMSVYYEKTCLETEDFDNEFMRQGRDLEDYVARRFMEETSLKVRRSNVMYQSETYPFMLANVDRLISGENMGLECKTASAYSADKWVENSVPAHYELQCHHYMAVTGAKAWYLAVVILGKEFKYKRIDRDEELIQNLITIEQDFWENHVLTRNMPDPDGSGISNEVINRYFPSAVKKSIPLSANLNEQLKRREEIIHLTNKLTQEQNQIEQQIKLYMGEYEIAFNENYRVTWSNVDTVRIDSKRLKEERPDLYRNFAKSSQSRRFTVKVA